jgi:hypothetical protein
MKTFFLGIYYELRLLLHDADKLVQLAIWFAKKSITPIVLTWIFWVAFQLITASAR